MVPVTTKFFYRSKGPVISEGWRELRCVQGRRQVLLIPRKFFGMDGAPGDKEGWWLYRNPGLLAYGGKPWHGPPRDPSRLQRTNRPASQHDIADRPPRPPCRLASQWSSSAPRRRYRRHLHRYRGLR